MSNFYIENAAFGQEDLPANRLTPGIAAHHECAKGVNPQRHDCANEKRQPWDEEGWRLIAVASGTDTAAVVVVTD